MSSIRSFQETPYGTSPTSKLRRCQGGLTPEMSQCYPLTIALHPTRTKTWQFPSILASASSPAHLAREEILKFGENDRLFVHCVDVVGLGKGRPRGRELAHGRHVTQSRLRRGCQLVNLRNRLAKRLSKSSIILMIGCENQQSTQ